MLKSKLGPELSVGYIFTSVGFIWDKIFAKKHAFR
jgi:hypothetical protein